MNLIEKIKQDHEDIERELIELEVIMSFDNINYPNLVHVFKKLRSIWNAHEEFEVGFFRVLEARGYSIPIEKILFDHEQLREHQKKIIDAINSGSESRVKESLFIDGKMMIEKIRAHVEFEDELLYTIPEDVFG